MIVAKLYKNHTTHVANQAYTLTNAWFTSKKLIEKNLSYGYHLIGSLKLNRCIYSEGIKISIFKFIGFIKKMTLMCLPLREINIKSTDIELDSKTILDDYSKRWKIETPFLYLRNRLGLKHYQMHKLKVLKRFRSIAYLTYTYLKLCRDENSNQKPKTNPGDKIKYV